MAGSDPQLWRRMRDEKVSQLRAKIPSQWRLTPEDVANAAKKGFDTGNYVLSLLEDVERRLVTMSASELISGLAMRSYTAEAVVRGFCKTAAMAHQLTNCLHEIFFEQAIEQARKLDQYFDEHNRPLGPLHGLPISLKDQFHVKNVDTTMGYIGWINTHEGNQDTPLVRNVNSQVVEDIISLGGVTYCKTSVPQTLFLAETINNLIGRTLNPLNPRLSCGGSSGGEAVLQILNGSPVGLGTDIGGSVRIPAACCGIYSLKPSHNRLSYRRIANTNPGQCAYQSSVGIMSRDLDSLRLLMRALLQIRPWLKDPEVIPIPWREEVLEETLKQRVMRFGLYRSDGIVHPHPPIGRALEEIAAALNKAGHEIVDWAPPSHFSAQQLHFEFLKADGCSHIHEQLRLSGEPLIAELCGVLPLTEPMSLLQYQSMNIQGKAFCEAYSDYWNSSTNGSGHVVDAVIMPVAAQSATVLGKQHHSVYTESINLLDYSSIVIPVLKIDKNKDIPDPTYIPLNDTDRLNWTTYDAELYHGMPVGVQIVGRKYEEEKVWALAKRVCEALEKYHSEHRLKQT